MKTLTVFLISAGLTRLWGILLVACNSEEPEATPASIRTVEELDNLSNRLQFNKATKIAGKIPASATGTSSSN
jgi:hypothetical protein